MLTTVSPAPAPKHVQLQFWDYRFKNCDRNSFLSQAGQKIQIDRIFQKFETVFDKSWTKIGTIHYFRKTLFLNCLLLLGSVSWWAVAVAQLWRNWIPVISSSNPVHVDGKSSLLGGSTDTRKNSNQHPAMVPHLFLSRLSINGRLQTRDSQFRSSEMTSCAVNVTL